LQIQYVQISAKLISYSYCAHFRGFFEPIFQLSDGKVDVSYGLTEYGVIYPFKKFNTNNIPDWWKSYNHVKHEWFECIDEATLKNNIEALTGLFMLNILYKKVGNILSHIKTLFYTIVKWISSHTILKIY
jgi:hypothetical protein